MKVLETPYHEKYTDVPSPRKGNFFHLVKKSKIMSENYVGDKTLVYLNCDVASSYIPVQINPFKQVVNN